MDGSGLRVLKPKFQPAGKRYTPTDINIYANRTSNTWSFRMNRSKSKTLCKFWIIPLAVIVLVVQGCATTKPPPVDPLAFKGWPDGYGCRTDRCGSAGDLWCQTGIARYSAGVG